MVLVFDKTNEQSFANIETWRDEVDKYSDNTTKILVGNKCDQEEDFAVTAEQGA